MSTEMAFSRKFIGLITGACIVSSTNPSSLPPSQCNRRVNRGWKLLSLIQIKVHWARQTVSLTGFLTGRPLNKSIRNAVFYYVNPQWNCNVYYAELIAITAGERTTEGNYVFSAPTPISPGFCVTSSSSFVEFELGGSEKHSLSTIIQQISIIPPKLRV